MNAKQMMQIPPRLKPTTAGAIEPRSALLLHPFYPKDPSGSFGKHVLTPALSLTSLAGATPQHWRVSMWDENLLQGTVPDDVTPEVVGITVQLTYAQRAYELAERFRARGSRVVLGGLHVDSCPDEARAHADAISVGNGVQTWPRILQDVERGARQPLYRGEFGDFADEPAPDRNVLPPWAYLTPLSLIASRGCHNRCDFCVLQSGASRPRRYQTLQVAQVVCQLEKNTSPYAVFIDNNLGSRRPFLRELCQAIAPLQRIWSAAVSLDVADDEALVQEMALAGCTGVFIGFESVHDENLRAAGKRCPPVADYARRVELFQRHGIQVNGSFVFGFDHDGPEVFRRTLDLVESSRMECATYHILTPYPGTKLFAQLESQGRLLHRDWSQYDTAHCVFQPARMSPAELERGYRWLYRQTFSLASIWKRRPQGLSAVPPYLAMALLYKRSNWLWPLLIRHRLVHRVWNPLVHLSQRRHLAFRRRLQLDVAPQPTALPFQATL